MDKDHECIPTPNTYLRISFLYLVVRGKTNSHNVKTISVWLPHKSFESNSTEPGFVTERHPVCTSPSREDCIRFVSWKNIPRELDCDFRLFFLLINQQFQRIDESSIDKYQNYFFALP